MNPAGGPQWGLVGTGGAGGAITSTYFDSTGGTGVDDRFLFLVTNQIVAQPHFDRIESAVPIEQDELARNHLVQFGPYEGVGGDYREGKRVAEADFGTIREGLTAALDGSDAIVYPLGLGGGTANGTVPHLVDRLSRESETDSAPAWLAGVTHFPLGVWPFEYESKQRHFNAVCGLSRLLTRSDGSQNADLTILASNSRLGELVSKTGGETDETDEVGDRRRINGRIAAALELFVSAARGGSHVITARDFTAVPKRHGIAHATFGTALGTPVALETAQAIDRAAENAFVPLDLSTVGAAYAVVRAPEARIESGDVTAGAVKEGFAEWKAERGLRNAVGMSKLVAAPDAESLDVLVVLGGFDLDPLLSPFWELYEHEKETVRESDFGPDKAEIDRLEENLDQYRSG